MTKKLLWILNSLFLSLSACSAESDGATPKGWKLLTKDESEKCAIKYQDTDGNWGAHPDFLTKCVGHRPPPTQEELDWLKERTKQRLIYVKGGEFTMGDFGALHTKNSTPPVSSDLGYLREGMDPLGKGKKIRVQHKVGSAYFMDDPSVDDLYGVNPHTVRLNDYSMTAYMVEEQEYNLYAAIKNDGLLDSASKHTYQDILDSRELPASVTWNQAQGYCKWLGEQIGQPMTLPTEAQWEYAGRNRGGFFVFPTNNGKIEYGDNIVQFVNGLSYDSGKESLQKFKSMPPNSLGFYNMLNLPEWMADWYQPEYDLVSPKDNPKGPDQGLLYQEIPTSDEKNSKDAATPLKVVRGGQSMSFMQETSFSRSYGLPFVPHTFRCVTNK